MDPLWLGPYAVKKYIGKGVYELWQSDGIMIEKKVQAQALHQVR